MFCAVARFFRPGYHNYIVQQWLPALDGVVEKLERGAKVADVGCGHGWSTVMMAKAFPKSTFIGYDFHPSSIEEAQAHAEMHGVSANTRFEVGLAKDYPGKDFDLVTCFDCLHDMGDPARRQRAYPAVFEARWHLDDCRAHGGRHAGAEPQPGRTTVLRRIDHDLPANLAGPGSRRGPRRPGGREETTRGDHVRRVQDRASCDRDAIQHGA